MHTHTKYLLNILHKHSINKCKVDVLEQALKLRRKRKKMDKQERTEFLLVLKRIADALEQMNYEGKVRPQKAVLQDLFKGQKKVTRK